jgi:quercetin dioxygenase-like cupin family protein
MSRTHAGVWLGSALIALTHGAEAASAQGRGNQAPPPPVTAPDREGFVIVTPEALAAARSSGGGRTHYLYGHPSQPGLYVLQIVWEPGQGSRPHTHNEARLINVLEGTWYVETGEAARTYNPDETTPVTAGTFIYEPADGIHYDMAKDQRVVVQIMGIGPVGTTQLEPSQAGSAPR